MSQIVRNLIQYDGISDDFPETSDVFKQLFVEDTFCLPEAKPDIEQIIKVIGSLDVKNKKIIKTTKGVSLEGQILSGWKLIIEGCIKLKIQYVADEPEQSVHSAHASIPFSTFIVLPEDFITGTPVSVFGYIEDVYSQQVCQRQIFNNITLLLTTEFC